MTKSENLIATLRHVTRNVKRWRGGDMIHRWASLGPLRVGQRSSQVGQCPGSLSTARDGTP